MTTKGRKSASRRTTRRKVHPKTIDAKANEIVKDTGDVTKAAGAKTDAAAEKPATIGSIAQSAGRTVPGIKPTAVETSKTSEPSRESAQKENTAKESKTSLSSPTKPANEAAAKSKTADPGLGKSPISPVQERKSGGFASMAASALLGGIVTAGGLGAIGQMDNASSLPLIGSIYGRADSGSNSQITNMKTEITSLKTKLDAVEKREIPSESVDVNNLESRLAKLEGALSSSQSTGDNEAAAANATKLAALAKQVSDLEGSIASRVVENGAEKSEDLKLLVGKIDALQEDLKSIDSRQASNDNPQISSLNEKTEAITKSVEGVSSRLEKLETTIADQVLSKMDEVVKAAEKATASEKVARAVAVSSLQSAITEDTPYLSALSSLETLVGPTSETARLHELAAAGKVPTVSELQRSFSALIPDLVGQPKTDNSSIFDKFVQSAKSLVTVRPSGPVSGDTPVAIVSRIEANLGNGQLDAVLTEWRTLPDSSKSIGGQWLKGLEMRIETNALLKIVLEQAKNAGSQG